MDNNSHEKIIRSFVREVELRDKDTGNFVFKCLIQERQSRYEDTGSSVPPCFSVPSYFSCIYEDLERKRFGIPGVRFSSKEKRLGIKYNQIMLEVIHDQFDSILSHIQVGDLHRIVLNWLKSANIHDKKTMP